MIIFNYCIFIITVSLGSSRSGTPLYSSPCTLGNNNTQSPLTVGSRQNMFLPIILPANQNYSTTPTGSGHITPPAINNNNNQYRQQQLVKYENLIFNLFNFHKKGCSRLPNLKN